MSIIHAHFQVVPKIMAMAKIVTLSFFCGVHSQPLRVSHFHKYIKEKENHGGRTEYDENVLF